MVRRRRQELDPVGPVHQRRDDAAVVGAVTVVCGGVGNPAPAPGSERELLERVGLTVCVVDRPAAERARVDRADVLVLRLLDEDHVGRVQIAHDLLGDQPEALLVDGVRGRDVVERSG